MDRSSLPNLPGDRDGDSRDSEDSTSLQDDEGGAQFYARMPLKEVGPFQVEGHAIKEPPMITYGKLQQVGLPELEAPLASYVCSHTRLKPALLK